MGKSSRKTIAAELTNPENRQENRRDADDASRGPLCVEGQGGDENQDFDGLVVLNSRRPPKERKLGSKTPPDREPNQIGEQIGEQLRNLYNDVLEQPVPERFIELLNKLESDPISAARSRAPGER
jgi:hypothetical protein